MMYKLTKEIRQEYEKRMNVKFIIYDNPDGEYGVIVREYDTDNIRKLNLTERAMIGVNSMTLEEANELLFDD